MMVVPPGAAVSSSALPWLGGFGPAFLPASAGSHLPSLLQRHLQLLAAHPCLVLQLGQALPGEAEQQASRMSIDEQGAQAFNKVSNQALVSIPLHRLSGLRLQGCAAGFEGMQISPDLTAEHDG